MEGKSVLGRLGREKSRCKNISEEGSKDKTIKVRLPSLAIGLLKTVVKFSDVGAIWRGDPTKSI